MLFGVRVTGVLAIMSVALVSGAAHAGSCSDAWVTKAVTQVLRRPPASASAPECNIYLYNNGHWNGYNELLAAVGVYWSMHAYPVANAQPAPAAANLKLGVSRSDFAIDSTALGFSRGVAPAPGRVVTYNGQRYQVAKVIAQGGGNVIAQGGGNVIAQGGGNVIAQGGGNLTVTLHLIGHDGGS